MRYMFLVYTQENHQLTPEERAQLMAGHQAVMEETCKRGILLAGEPLEPTSTALTVRHQNGRPVVIDGPFAETKEQLAGYYIIDCKDQQEAIEWAKKIPTGCGGGQGSIEIRLIRDISELQKNIKQSLQIETV
jgi:hypothetical protein